MQPTEQQIRRWKLDYYEVHLRTEFGSCFFCHVIYPCPAVLEASTNLNRNKLFRKL